METTVSSLFFTQQKSGFEPIHRELSLQKHFFKKRRKAKNINLEEMKLKKLQTASRIPL